MKHLLIIFFSATLTLSPTLSRSATAQFISQDYCNEHEFYFVEGYCVAPGSMVLTVTSDNVLIIAGRIVSELSWFPNRRYSVILANEGIESDSPDFRMGLDENRQLIEVDWGNLAITENYRSQITKALDLLDSYSPQF
jgi:hypothetical protein